VGPNNTWWSQFKPFAQATSRLCWLNTDSRHVCGLAILGVNDYLPWRPAKVCFQHQRDFNYLEARHFWEDAQVDSEGIHLAGMHYRAVILEEEAPAQAKAAIETLAKAGRVIRWSPNMSESALIQAVDKLVAPDVRVSPEAADLRVRHMRKGGQDYYLLFNEGEGDLELSLDLSAQGQRTLLNPETGAHERLPGGRPVKLARHAMRVLLVG
jgi:hypothetical protein